MTAYVALLRGIGPVTHKKMALGKLVAACAEAGLSDVVSIGNTGNLVFRSEHSQSEVEAIVSKAVKSFGLELDVFSRTKRQIQMLVGEAPFPDAAEARPEKLGICFFRKTPNWPASYRDYKGPERMVMFSNHLCVDYMQQVSASKLTIEKTTGARMTQRNWSSVLKIAAKLEPL